MRRIMHLPMILLLLSQLSHFALCLFRGTMSYTDETEQLSLLDIKNGLFDDGSNDPALELNSWNTTLHFCQWQGITCGSLHQRVTALRLPQRGFGGTLSSSIGNLTFLKVLDLSGNKLRGRVPKEIGLLSRLQFLNISRNTLEGSALLHLTNCTELLSIDLSRNNGLTDTIPSQIGSLSKLQTFIMGQTNLGGEIPRSIGNLSALINLSLFYTYLQGGIPAEMGKLKQMTRLDFTFNSLSGSVPSALYNLSYIKEISFTGNGLIGDFPPMLGVGFPHLRIGYFGLNNFTGGVPPTLQNISGLEGIDFGGNQLAGDVPTGLGRLQDLSYFSIEDNNLGSGKNGDLAFIDSLTNISSLRVLSFMGNEFGGLIPNIIGNLSSTLEQLYLGSNRMMYGSIPQELGNLVSLILLDIKTNNMSGDIPSSMGNLRRLGELDLSGNRLQGSIPLFFGNLTSLNTLLLYNNQLEGAMPSTLRYCSKLQTLFLYGNRLSGTIPGEIISGLSSLVSLKLYGNSFTGSIPGEVGNLVQLSLLDISKNKFTGEVPDELGRCLMLEILKMEENSFKGSIPLSLAHLKMVRIIDLSSNNLTGSIPMELQGLSSLQIFNASFNQLEGEVPIQGAFANLSVIYLQGNKRLCGGLPQLGLPRCSRKQMSRRHVSIKAVIGIATSLSACLVLAVVFLYLIMRKGLSSKYTVLSIPPKKFDTFPRLSYKELLKATNGFSTSNLIGVGSFSLVYRGVLEGDGKLIAVKVMNLSNRGAAKSFIAECKVLSKVRHRNLLQILSYCSSLDLKGKDFMAMVFELMPSGNLDTWLHVSRNLKFSQRVEIAIDIASALDYLHHHCEPQVVHCDLKPSNVLLDIDMVAHVGDFGLAKLLHGGATDDFSNGQSSSLAVKGTVGYVPPEYGMGGSVSTRGDVYSYGILLLEMITGKKPTDLMFEDGTDLRTLCSSAIGKSTLMNLDQHLLTEMDISIDDMGKGVGAAQPFQDCVMALTELGIACSAENPYERVGTGHALSELHKIRAKVFQFNSPKKKGPPFPYGDDPSFS
uniref:non-specific serine/threonine protein kinase n=1 Tax=Kalanchoe fedtschenkoi TaxID=63787 RepID=A0A7N0RFU8_KALFE